MDVCLRGAYGVPGLHTDVTLWSPSHMYSHLTHKLSGVPPVQPPEAQYAGVPPGHEAHQAPVLHLAPPHAGLGVTPGLTGHSEGLALAGVILLAWSHTLSLSWSH